VRLAGPSTGAATAEELRLLQRLPACLEALDTVEPADRQDLRTVLRHITHGQSLDLQRFADPGEVAALPDAAALDQYTYLVAGCVGEFWTTQCLRHVPDFAALPADTMRALGREYGMGLQLVNILRDCGQDLAQGRCYLPADELAAEGLGPAQAQAAPVALRPVWDRWHARALGRIDAGLRYAQAVHSARIRAAGVLPALLGVRTLALLQAAGPAAFTRRVKVPRAEVRWILGRLVFTLARPGLLAGQYLRLREQPVNGWDNPRR
jgi:farnesyl-diphosphate farnesyltransferase